MKQLDKIKSLQSALKTMEEKKEIRDYLECRRMINSLRAEIKNSVMNELIIKPNGFGFRRSFKSWSDVNLIDAQSDCKQVRGVLRGDKKLANIVVSHVSPSQRDATANFSIKGWIGK
jgi:hypothetical protein|tara:strand:+ start:219 stop:569 length:351 start_codon:yes stop_codon:yes gene_type:complete